MRKILCKTAIAASLALMGMTALAETTATGSSAPATDTQTAETANPSPALASTPTDKLIARFSTFSGSEENAASLVNGLRTGSEITLTDSTSGSASSSVTFTPPTKPMGYGNIRIALSLAEAQLKSQGISQPTAEQLQTALMGDMSGATAQTTSQTQGILQMRASGMGWGQIANSMGFKLGTVMSGRAPANTTTTTPSGTESGAMTAAGATPGASGKGQSARASGIVTATGASAGGGSGRNYRALSATGNANGHAAATGSASASSSGAVSAQGAGRGVGNAYGHSK